MTETYHNGSRLYEIDGEKYYSVTSILKIARSDEEIQKLNDWRKRVGFDKANEIGSAAAARGTLVHKLIEDYKTGIEPDFDNPEYEPAIAFWEGLKPVLDDITDIKYQEEKVWHPIYRFAGRLDCYATFRGVENTLIDYKTSDKPKKVEWITDYFIQSVAYASGVKHLFGHSTNQTVIIIALPNKPAQVFTLTREDMVYYWDIWLQKIQIFRRKMGLVS